MTGYADNGQNRSQIAGYWGDETPPLHDDICLGSLLLGRNT
jgi:hypothetical protein